jgi:hypothetical protein
MKAGEIYQEAYRYEGAALSELKLKCDLLILTFHLKQAYLNNVEVPGKFKPGHDKAIEKYADLRVWLTPNPESQVPVGLVMKNISRRRITEQGIQTSQVLPLKLSQCNWANVWHYWDEPMGDRRPEEHERPNSFELSLIEGTLTPEDKRLYEASLSLVEKRENEERAEQLLVKQSQERAIREFIDTGIVNNGDGLISIRDLPGPAKMAILREKIETGELIYDNEITISKVNEWSE